MGRPTVREFTRRIPAGIRLETMCAESSHAKNIVRDSKCAARGDTKCGAHLMVGPASAFARAGESKLA